MPRCRVFISHSTSGNKLGYDVLEAIVSKLSQKKEQFGLLWDRSALQTGEDWRSAINMWLGICDVAILFITTDALASDYCAYEWNVLSYRRSQDPNFLIVPVYYKVGRTDVKGKPHQ